MMIKEITIDVDIPEGYEETGEFRTPKAGDIYFSAGGNKAVKTSTDFEREKYIILRKKEPPIDWMKTGWVNDNHSEQLYQITGYDKDRTEQYIICGHWRTKEFMGKNFTPCESPIGNKS